MNINEQFDPVFWGKGELASVLQYRAHYNNTAYLNLLLNNSGTKYS